MMSDPKQDVYNKINENEANIERSEKVVTMFICTAMPVAMAIYAIMF
jgi:hypothetical protein